MSSAHDNNPPQLASYLESLGLPLDMCDRGPPESLSRVEEVCREFDRRAQSQTFLIGVMSGFIALVEDLLAQVGASAFSDGLESYPPLEVDGKGRTLNTLTIVGPERRIGLRKYYNYAERTIVTELRRYGYPNCAPHATQSWSQHRDLLESIFSLSPSERLSLMRRVWENALALEAFNPRSVEDQSPRPFTALIRDFPNTKKGEPAGAVLQALAFAYYRADAPNVTLETGKVGAGSARSGRVGDVDGWSGDTLSLSVEVKDSSVAVDAMHDFGGFLSNLKEHPDATAIVLARDFDNESREKLHEQGVRVLDRESMARNVELWDLRKQQLAFREFHYYLWRIQRNARLLERFETFASDRGLLEE